MHKFAAASETELIVFGAARPGYGDAEIAKEWKINNLMNRQI